MHSPRRTSSQRTRRAIRRARDGGVSRATVVTVVVVVLLERLYDAVEAGDVNVSYHLVNLLDGRSDPPGCSLRAANAALAVAIHSAPGFPDFHRSLFATQPPQANHIEMSWRHWRRHETEPL